MNKMNVWEVLGYRRRESCPGKTYCSKCGKEEDYVQYAITTMETECELCFIKRMAQHNNQFMKMYRMTILHDFVNELAEEDDE